MSDRSFDFLLISMTIALTIFGAIIASTLQQRSWGNQRWSQIRDERSKAALSTVQAVSRLIDKRLYRQRLLTWSLGSGDDNKIEENRQNYKNIVIEWMDSLGTVKSELWASFDWQTMVDFEKEIHDEFALIGSNIERAIRQKSHIRLVDEEKRLDRLGYDSYRFMNGLLQRISEEKIRGLDDRLDLSIANEKNLTYSYLIKKLFGVPIKSDAV